MPGGSSLSTRAVAAVSVLLLLGAGGGLRTRASADVSRDVRGWGVRRTAAMPSTGWAARVAARTLDPLRRGGAPVLTKAKVRPTDGPITGFFGESRGHGGHPGVDLDGETGDPIRAAAAGTVVEAGPAGAGWGGYGIVVLIDHGQGVQSLYAHLSAVSVVPGRVVGPGELVGAMGSTGFSTGSHLHFEVRVNGEQVDPLAWLGAAGS